MPAGATCQVSTVSQGEIPSRLAGLLFLPESKIVRAILVVFVIHDPLLMVTVKVNMRQLAILTLLGVRID